MCRALLVLQQYFPINYAVEYHVKVLYDPYNLIHSNCTVSYLPIGWYCRSPVRISYLEIFVERLRSQNFLSTHSKVEKPIDSFELLYYSGIMSAFTSDSNDEYTYAQLAPFNPSSVEAQKLALNLLRLHCSDVLFDLGCGDGRFLIAAATRVPELQCVGIEIDQNLHDKSCEALKETGPDIQSRVFFRSGNVLQCGYETCDGSLSLESDATALFLFLLPKGLMKLRPLLERLVTKRKQEGMRIRIVTYMFSLKWWTPKSYEITSKGGCLVYLYEFD